MMEPIFRPVADHAVLVEFGESISDAAHHRVLGLDLALHAAPFPGFEEAVPAYVNLLVEFDPLVTDHATVETVLRAMLSVASPARAAGRLREILVCYDDEFAPDLDALAEQTGLSREAVINAHLAGDYRVYMYGFAPGYAYLAGVPSEIQRPRKSAAVRGVAAGSVLVAGPQSLVSTLVMPTGWWILGRSPTKILTNDPDRPFLFDVGDRVTFRRIDRAGYARLQAGA